MDIISCYKIFKNQIFSDDSEYLLFIILASPILSYKLIYRRLDLLVSTINGMKVFNTNNVCKYLFYRTEP